MDGWHCGVCGNRIYLAAAIRSAYARSHLRNFVSAPRAAVPTVVQRTFARRLAEWVGSSCAHARTAGRGGGAVVPWRGGTDCTCLRPGRSQREAAAARCHSCVHSVWDRKKGHFTLVLSISYIFTWPRWPLLRARVWLCGATDGQTATLTYTTATTIHTRAPTSTEFGPTLRHTASTLRVHAAESGCAPCNMAEQ